MSEDRKSDGKKHDAGKLRMDLIPPEAEMALAAVMMDGAAKYGEGTWREVESWRWEAAMRRHLAAYKLGERCDPESGLLHLAHVLANAAFFMIAVEREQ